jgi:hypothetical protein
MPNSTIQAKVYSKPDELVVQAGGNITVEAGGQINLLAPQGAIYFVDSVNGSDSNDGLSWGSALKTIAAAVALAVAGDTILIKGSFSEEVTVSVAGLSIIGAGTTPRQAQWTADADETCLTLAAQHCVVRNIYFKPPAYSAGTPAAIVLSGASHARILDCQFQGQTASHQAIYSPVCNSDNVHILRCEFRYLNTATYGAAILGVEAGGLSYSAWRIKDCVFQSCVTAININGRVCEVTGNTVLEYGITAAGAVGAVLALGIDLSGTSSGGNAVWGNQLGGTYNATLYKVGASGDQWAGNWNVLTGGVTAANPA